MTSTFECMNLFVCFSSDENFSSGALSLILILLFLRWQCHPPSYFVVVSKFVALWANEVFSLYTSLFFLGFVWDYLGQTTTFCDALNRPDVFTPFLDYRIDAGTPLFLFLSLSLSFSLSLFLSLSLLNELSNYCRGWLLRLRRLHRCCTNHSKQSSSVCNSRANRFF